MSPSPPSLPGEQFLYSLPAQTMLGPPNPPDRRGRGSRKNMHPHFLTISQERKPDGRVPVLEMELPALFPWLGKREGEGGSLIPSLLNRVGFDAVEVGAGSGF